MKDIRDSLYAKTGGFIKGVCHPDNNYSLLKGAGFGWVRMDIPYPYGADGNVEAGYTAFKEKISRFAENGIRAVVISPYPREFIKRGIDPREEGGLEKVREVCRAMAEDFKGMGVCWQATNEMFVVGFRAPLTEAEAKDFIIACIEGLKEGDPRAAVGHNTAAHGWDEYCVEIEEKCDCDYIGFDLYNGTWSNGGPSTYIDRINALYALVHKPVVLMEFGFASLGKNASPDFHEAFDYLNSLGFKDKDDLMARADEFVSILPERLKKTALTCAPEDRETAYIMMMPHLLKMWFAEEVFPHDEEGQERFYRELLPMLLENPYLGGAVLYCWQDSDICYTCGASDCPCETAWGILRADGSTKPAYNAIAEIFG